MNKHSTHDSHSQFKYICMIWMNKFNLYLSFFAYGSMTRTRVSTDMPAFDRETQSLNLRLKLIDLNSWNCDYLPFRIHIRRCKASFPRRGARATSRRYLMLEFSLEFSSENFSPFQSSCQLPRASIQDSSPSHFPIAAFDIWCTASSAFQDLWVLWAVELQAEMKRILWIHRSKLTK